MEELAVHASAAITERASTYGYWSYFVVHALTPVIVRYRKIAGPLLAHTKK